MGIYAIARSVGARVRVALFVLGATIFSFVLFPFHLYWYVLVDIEAYLLLLLAMSLLWTGRTWQCLGVSLVGLLFKEFLGIPGLIACVTIALDARLGLRKRVALASSATRYPGWSCLYLGSDQRHPLRNWGWRWVRSSCSTGPGSRSRVQAWTSSPS